MGNCCESCSCPFRWTSAVQNDWLASSSPSTQDAKSNLAQQQQQQLPALRGHHQFHQHLHHQFHLEGNELHHMYSSRLDVGHSLKSGEDESELVNDQNSSHDKLLGDLRSHRQSRDESDDGLDFDNISTELERELLALKVHVARSHALLLQYQSKSLGGSKSEMSTHSAPAPSTDVLAASGLKNSVVSSSAAGVRISRDFSTVPDEGRDSSSLHSLLHCPSCGHNALLPSQASVGSITAAVAASAATISPTTATTTTFPISLGVATTTIATQTSPASSVLDLTQAEDDTTARTLTESESRSKEFLNTTIEEEIEPDDSKRDEREERKVRKRGDDEEDQYQVDEITIKLDNLNLADSLEALNITSHQLPSVKLTGTVSSNCLGSSKNNFMTTTDLDMAVSGDHNLYTPKPSFDHLEQYRPVTGRRGLGEEKVRRSGLATVAPKRGGGSDSDDDDDDELGCEGSPHQGTTSSSSSSSARGAAAGGPSRLLRRRHTAPPPHTLTTSPSSPAEDNTPPDGEDKEYVPEASFPSSASHLHSLLQRPLLPSLPAIDDDETHSESGSPSPPASPSGPRSLTPSSQKSGTVEGEENETSRERSALGLVLSSSEGSGAKLTTSSTPVSDAVDTSLPKAEVRPRSLSSITVFPSLDENLLPGSLFTNAVLSAENLSPQDIEGKFGQLSLAFKTDRLTLRQRMDVQQRERDTADVNFESEVQQLREATLALQTACVEPELREAVAKVKKNIDVLSNTAERLVSSSEVWGAVQQEWRVSKALEVLFLHVENVKRHHERDHHELEETKKLLNEYQIPLPSASPTSSISSLSAANLDSPSTARRLRALSLAAPIKQESRRSSVTRPAMGAGGRRASLFANARPFKEMALVAAAAAAAACGGGQQSEKEDNDRTHGNGSVWGSSIQEEGSEAGKDLSDGETSRTPTPPGGHEGQNGVANGSSCVYGSEDDEDYQEDAQDDSESQEERRPSTSAIPRSKPRPRPMEWRLPRIPTVIRDHWLVEGFGEIIEWLRGGTWPYTSQQTVLGARYAVSSLFLVIAILFVVLTLSRGDTMQNSCHPGWNWPFFLRQMHPFVSVYCNSPPF
ncbi:uncharacterized protein LOC143024083 [Oratosquilla oratoria]|uniref:uncharacterized protein LOC143024083 n=1 Tax=Oratosquilla oratoria TaxID=337810 RepID=UPI003F76804A